MNIFLAAIVLFLFVCGAPFCLDGEIQKVSPDLEKLASTRISDVSYPGTKWEHAFSRIDTQELLDLDKIFGELPPNSRYVFVFMIADALRIRQSILSEEEREGLQRILRKASNDEQWAVRLAFLNNIYVFNENEQVKIQLAMVHDDEREVRMLAIARLADVESPALLSSIISELEELNMQKNQDEQFRAVLLQSLHKLRSKETASASMGVGTSSEKINESKETDKGEKTYTSWIWITGGVGTLFACYLLWILFKRNMKSS